MPLLRKFSPPLLLPFCCVLLFAACGETDKTDAGSSSLSAVTEPPEDEFSREVEAFTGGHTKVVWSRYLGNGSDVFANYDKLQLWGFDSRDGLGIRPILEEESNYARPMVTPDGSAIVFTHKNTTRGDKGEKRFAPVSWRVDWDGENLTELGPGHALDVWRDPETGTDWVYVIDLKPTERSSISGRKLERFPLDDPGKREEVWSETRVSADNFQLSAQGKRASFLFPWPHAGTLDLETMTQKQYQNGCWPSMAPDDSHHVWVFDGAHKNLCLFTEGSTKPWHVPVNHAPGVGGAEVYHPRWSNHVRYMAMTGPYRGETVTRSDSGEVEVYLGKFSPDLKEMAEWFQLTDDDQGDLFPDLWIAGGELAKLETSGTGVPAAVAEADAAPAGEWPIGDGPFHFAWKNRDADNRSGDRECSVEAKDKARYGPHFEMLTDGGYFEMDGDSASAIGTLVGQPFTFEINARPDSTEGTGRVFESPFLTILQSGSQWVFSTPEHSGSLGTAEAGRADHLVVKFDGKEFHSYQNGAPVPEMADPPPPLVGWGAKTATRLGFEWNGSLEGVAISGSAASPEQIAASHAYWEKVLAAREPIPTVKIRGKLIEMTEARPVEALDTYTRGLLGYRYEVEEVLEGDLDADTVMVMHWTILDRQPLSGFPREIGQRHELLLQPYSAHPELVSERQWNDLFDPAEPWFDISAP